MKKIFSLILCVLMVTVSVSALVACGSKDNRTDLNVLSFRVEDKDYYKWFEKEFEKEYPDINIEYEAVDTQNYNQLLTSRLTANKVDVIGSQPTFFFDAAILNKMADISDMNIWEGIYDYVLDECTYDNKKLIAPTSVVSGVVFYNKDMFAEAGITAVPTNWSEFIQVCEKLKTHLGGISTLKAPIVTGLLEPWPVNILVDTIEANSVRGEEPDFFYNLAVGDTDMKNVHVRDMVSKVQKISEYFESEATGMQYSMVPGRFSTGNYGMMIDGSWQLSQIRACEPDFEVGTFLLPTNDETSKNVNMCYKTGGGFSVVKNTGNEENAKKFIEFHMRKDVMQKYVDMCMMGPVSDEYTITDPLANEFYSNPDYNYIFLAENMFVRGMQGFKADLMIELMTGRKTLDETVDELQESHENFAGVWAGYAADWIEKYYPEKGAN